MATLGKLELSKAAKQNIAFFFLAGGPLVLLGVVAWELHTPEPATRTPVEINRNALLPHGYAGPCMNCHRIQEVGPMDLDVGNMWRFDVTARDRALLEGGQRVVVPDLALELRVPALTRDDVLPHDYVGVCSNCHVILDVRPSPAYFAAALDNAHRELSPMAARRPGPTIDPTEYRSDTDEVIRIASGFVALFLFLWSAGYVVVRTLMRMYPERYKGRFKLKNWMKFHQLASIALLPVVLVHWYFSDRGNTLLHLAGVILFWLGAAGFAMRKNAVRHNAAKKGLRLVHTQRYLFIGLVLLLIVGHFWVAVP